MPTIPIKAAARYRTVPSRRLRAAPSPAETPTAISPTGAACMIDRCCPKTSNGTARMPPPAPASARISPTTVPRTIALTSKVTP